MSIFIDAGTTTAFLIHELVNKNITVVTNSIHHAAQLVEKQIPTVMVGGSVKMATDASIGGVALNQINQLHFDRAFIGMNGVDDGYYTTPDMEEGAVKRAILEKCQTELCLGGFVKNWTNLLCQGSTTQTSYCYHKSRA